VGFESGIRYRKISLVMSGRGSSSGPDFWSDSDLGKTSHETGNGDGDGKIFHKRRRVWGGIPRCYTESGKTMLPALVPAGCFRHFAFHSCNLLPCDT
jgi:hypothetical protein